MSISLEKIYYTAMRNYGLNLVAGTSGIWNSVSWIHMVENINVVRFLKGQELVIITGVNCLDKEQLTTFTKAVYEQEASGLIFNIGPFIPEVPEEIIAFGDEHGFPIFTIGWEVHLVDFNREFCNVISHSEQENQNLCSTYRNAIFAPHAEDGYLPFLKRENISMEEGYCMVQCVPRCQDRDGTEYDFTKLFYEMRKHFEKIMNRTKKRYVIFRHENSMTIIVPSASKKDIEDIIKEGQHFSFQNVAKGELYFAVSKFNMKIRELAEHFEVLGKMCALMLREQKFIWYWDELGVWNLIFSVSDQRLLWNYKEQQIGKLEAYDKENGTEYLKVLESYLSLNGNMPEVASAHFIHRNTVAYYLKKIEEILECDIYCTEDRVRLYMALQIGEVLKL